MHELGIVFHIIKSVERVAAENELEKVSAVVLELGEVSGVVPDTSPTAGSGRRPRRSWSAARS